MVGYGRRMRVCNKPKSLGRRTITDGFEQVTCLYLRRGFEQAVLKCRLGYGTKQSGWGSWGGARGVTTVRVERRRATGRDGRRMQGHGATGRDRRRRQRLGGCQVIWRRGNGGVQYRGRTGRGRASREYQRDRGGHQEACKRHYEGRTGVGLMVSVCRMGKEILSPKHVDKLAMMKIKLALDTREKLAVSRISHSADF